MTSPLENTALVLVDSVTNTALHPNSYDDVAKKLKELRAPYDVAQEMNTFKERDIGIRMLDLNYPANLLRVQDEDLTDRIIEELMLFNMAKTYVDANNALQRVPSFLGLYMICCLDLRRRLREGFYREFGDRDNMVIENVKFTEEDSRYDEPEVVEHPKYLALYTIRNKPDLHHLVVDVRERLDRKSIASFVQDHNVDPTTLIKVYELRDYLEPPQPGS